MPDSHLPDSHLPGSRPVASINPARRRRYARSSSRAACVPMTPLRVEILRFLAELRFLSLPQIARLCCPSARQDLSEKNARRHMRALFDAGLVDVLPVSRAALAPPGTPNDASLLYGSAPNVYCPTARGLEALYRTGLIEKELLKRAAPNYGPKNSLFLAHELQVRDVRVWLETAAQVLGGGQKVFRWQAGSDAALGAGASCTVRPDAWFVYSLGRRENREAVLVGLVEVDRGTERGDKRWQEKLAAYESLFSGEALRAATGYVNARVLVVAPDGRHRDRLAGLIATVGSQTISPMTVSRFWISDWLMLNTPTAIPSLRSSVWRRPGLPALQPLVGETTEA